jgi:FlaG/FlaF family flagellin (archaellin)
MRSSLSRDGRGVTSVVALALLVGIVVIVAATTGGYLFELSSEVDDPAPQVAFSYHWDKPSRTLTITHESGTTIDDANTGRLVVRIEDEDETGGNDFDVAEKPWVADDGTGVYSYPIKSGDSFVITGESRGGDIDVEQDGTDSENFASETHLPEIEDVVTITWHSNDGEQTHVLSRFVIPRGKD